MDDLVEAIGVDAARYALARYTTDTTIDIDLDLWAKAVQRQPGLLRAVRPRPGLPRSCATPPTSGLVAAPGPARLRPDAARPRAGGRAAPGAGRVPARGRGCGRAARAAPGRPLPRGDRGAYHRFYDTCRVLPMGDEEPTDLHRARLLLVDATRTVLANGLRLLGVSAPERM